MSTALTTDSYIAFGALLEGYVSNQLDHYFFATQAVWQLVWEAYTLCVGTLSVDLATQPFTLVPAVLSLHLDNVLKLLLFDELLSEGFNLVYGQTRDPLSFMPHTSLTTLVVYLLVVKQAVITLQLGCDVLIACLS